MKTTINTKLCDAMDPDEYPKLTGIAIDLWPSGMAIGVEGYGDCATEVGHGRPILVEMVDGVLKVHVWADINSDEPTHSISLEGAREGMKHEA